MFKLFVKQLSIIDLTQNFHGEDLSLVYKIYNATMCCMRVDETIEQKWNNPF